MTTIARTFGHLSSSADVPQVKAAIRLLTHGGQPLAAFDETDRCVSAGAYLDPRRSTGEVVLGYCSEDRQDHCGRTTRWDSEELHAERERIITEYAELFRGARWAVEEFQEPDRSGRDRLVRLIMKPPALSVQRAVEAEPAARKPHAPLALGELPVSSVPAAYDRGHLYSPSATLIEHIEHRPGDLFAPLPAAPHERNEWFVWWREEAHVATPDFLGLKAGDEITIQHADGISPGTVLSTCRFGAFVHYVVPTSQWAIETYVDMYVTKRNQFGHWYR